MDGGFKTMLDFCFEPLTVLGMRNSKHFNAAIRFLTTGGQVLPDGTVVGISGRTLKPRDQMGYYSVSVKHEGITRPVKIHLLQALQKFGIVEVAKAAHIRHLDGDSRNNSLINIALGSQSDNMLDQPEVTRKLRASNASRGRGKLTEAQWEEVARDYASGLGYKKLAKKWGVGMGSLSYRLSKNAKRKIM